MAWSDIFKLWTLATTRDPFSRRLRARDIEGAAVTQPDAVPDIRADGSFWSGGRGIIRLRESSDFIDLSSVTNRQSRYKEYERLRMVPEIETGLTVFADEACVAGKTKIATPLYGFISIRDLAIMKEPDERFLVYCWDFATQDYTLGWAFHPRFVSYDYTCKVVLENGRNIECTPDHRILLRDGTWREAGKLHPKDELMPFYRIRQDRRYNKYKSGQFPRIFTHKESWKHERDFINEWKSGKKNPRKETFRKIMRLLQQGLDFRQIGDMIGMHHTGVKYHLTSNGYSAAEVQRLTECYPDRLRVVNVYMHHDQDVYDLSVANHENFATDVGIMHNCQIGDNGHLFKVDVKNQDVQKELEFLYFHPIMLNLDRRLWNMAKNLFIFGDHFLELVLDPEEPKAGILQAQNLPADSMYRIETIKGKLLEFQQSKEGPDYQSLARVEVTQASQADLAQATAIRFVPDSIIHMKIGDDRRTFYPYGVSVIEAARGPAHSLRLAEDSMLVYRLSRSAERRVFYIDVGQLPPFKAEAFIERMKDQFRKRRTYNVKGDTGRGGPSPMEERWVAPTVDEDFWVPIRPNSQTRVDTLPGAQNLDQVADVEYWRTKLFVAMNFPKDYMGQEDASATRVTVSSRNVQFARLIERMQHALADGIQQIGIRHLRLRGFPEESYDDLSIRLTPPSNYRELSENEIKEAQFSRAMALKGSQLLADLDILVKVLKFPEEEAKQMVSRSTIQRLQELKLNVMAQNPQLLGLALPGTQGPPLAQHGEQAPGEQAPGQPGEQEAPEMPEGGEAMPGSGEMSTQARPPTGQTAPETFGQPETQEGPPLPEPTEDDIEKYDLDIGYSGKDIDEEEPDEIELDDY